jgi:hypothetical protein
MSGRAAPLTNHPRARAAALPHEALADPAFAAQSSFSETPPSLPDRLAWPVAAAAILASCAGLWLAVGGLARLLLG